MCHIGERRALSKRDRRVLEVGAVLQAALQATIVVELLPGTTIDVFVQVGTASRKLGRPAVSVLAGKYGS